MNKYYPLHVHSANGSIGDSILRIRDYVKRAKEYGLDAIALTDHGALSAVHNFASVCQENGIKPIVGMEAYACENNEVKDKNQVRYHLVLLAKTEEGLKNLFRIHNNAATDGFYYRPLTDDKHLEEWGKGIIALSACVAGQIPQLILEGKFDEAKEVVAKYTKYFDDFYLELQPGSFQEQIQINDSLVKLSQETGAKLILTNDIHYLNADDYKVHDYHVKLGRNDIGNDKLIYPDTCYWFMDAETVSKHVVRTEYVTDAVVEVAIKNTEVVAAACNTPLSDALYMPKAKATKKEEETLLYRICFERLNNILANKMQPQAYIDRLTKELKVIISKGFAGYFLVVQDYINWARDNGIPVGPGRGSVAGSLVSYLLGISQADPIQYDLMFERFLDPNREAVPDIDTDFGCAERTQLFEYIVEKYGVENCALLSTLHVRKAKSAIRDAVRILNLPVSLGDEISSHIPTIFYGDDGEKSTDLTIEESIAAVKELKELYAKHEEVFELAKKLEGLPSSQSIHAAGILISPTSLTDKTPMIRSNKDGIYATALSLNDAEKNFVKFDFLGLATLAVLRNTEKDVNWTFDYSDDSLYEDEEVWKVIGSSMTTGLFQIGSNTYKKRMARLKPTTIEELAACLALVRGPCISAKTDELYMSILEGKEKVKRIHPIYDRVTKSTLGILVYQEQIINLVVGFGMDLTTGYRIVKLSAKKKMEELKKYREEFVKLAMKKDCCEKVANQIFDLIVKSGEYSFNKSHAISYALLTYASAYLKVHYPLAFIKNLLSNAYERGERDVAAEIFKEACRLGIKFLPACINKSEWNFSIENNKIRIGLCAVKGLGEKAVEQIMEHRPFASLEDVIDKVSGRQFNVKALNISIFSGLLDDIKEEGESRVDLYNRLCEIKGKDPVELISFSRGFAINVNAIPIKMERDFYQVPFINLQHKTKIAI